MTARKTRAVRAAVAEGFGTGFQPPQARSSMMKVAGASDAEVPDDEELLVDDESTMPGPIYPEGTVRMRVSSLRRLVRLLATG